MISDYTPSEMMIVAAARALVGVRTVFVGVRLPNITCNLARRTVAPGLELAEVQAEIGWELRVAPHLRETEPPTVKELRLLREELDPQGVYTG